MREKFKEGDTVISSMGFKGTVKEVFKGSLVVKGEGSKPFPILKEFYDQWKIVVTTTGTSVKLDKGKLRYDLMPFDALDAVAEVLTYGIKKYPKPEENWRVNSTLEDIPRYKAARLRHISLAAQGQVFDEESGLPHEWHISTNSLFIIALEKKYGVYND